MACGCHPNGEGKNMSEMVTLYKGDSVTKYPEGSREYAACIADGWSREKPSVETLETMPWPPPGVEEADGAAGRRGRKRTSGR